MVVHAILSKIHSSQVKNNLSKMNNTCIVYDNLSIAQKTDKGIEVYHLTKLDRNKVKIKSNPPDRAIFYDEMNQYYVLHIDSDFYQFTTNEKIVCNYDRVVKNKFEIANLSDQAAHIGPKLRF